MQNAPYNYEKIYAEGDYTTEYKVNIDGTDYDQGMIWSLKTSRKLFTESVPMIGQAMVGQIDMTITEPDVTFAKQAKIKPYIRIRSRSNTSLVSGWVQKGEFFIDTRPTDEEDGIVTMDIQGYDAMRKANQKYPSSTLYWSETSPKATQVVREIARFMGVSVDNATVTKLDANPYVIAFPAQYTMAEVLGSIAAMYGGNFCISDTGTLLLIGLMDLPEETYYLVDEDGDCITFGIGENETIIVTR